MSSYSLVYDLYPKTLVRKYKEANRRDKARAFLEWWSDGNSGIKNSERFYAKEWRVGVATSHAWIKEFKEFEIEVHSLCE